MLNGIYILDTDAFDLVYGESERADIARHVHMVGHKTRAEITANPAVLSDVDVIFAGWGMATLDETLLAAAPRLKAVFYAAGAAAWLTQNAIDRDIKVTTAQIANSVPVAEYTLAMILLSLKHAFQLAHQTRSGRYFPDRNGCPGCYGATVGLISYGTVAKVLRERLRAFDLNVLAYDPFLTADEAAADDIELADLDEVFERSDVVSLHTPLLPETYGLITGHHIASMKLGATFINTARGPVVREEEMLDVLSRRLDLQAVLDVTHVEPPASQSRIYSLPNVLLTPHIAGSAGLECRRMGRHMVHELERFLRGEPFATPLDFSRLSQTSNRPRSTTGSVVAASH